MPIQKNQVNGPISSPDTRSGAFARSDERPSLDELIARADSESREHGRREVAAARLAEFDASDAYRRSREDLLALVGPIVDVLPTMEGYQREKVPGFCPSSGASAAREPPVEVDPDCLGLVNPAIVFTHDMKESPYSPLVLSDDDSYQEALDATEMLSQFWEGTASANELSLARALIVHVVLAYPDLREAVFERASIVARGLSGSVRWCFEGWSKASDTLR